MVLAEASFGKYIFLLDRVHADKQAQTWPCVPFQLVYDSQLDMVPEFCFSTEEVLVPGGPWLLIAMGRDCPSPYLLINKTLSFSSSASLPLLLPIAIYANYMR